MNEHEVFEALYPPHRAGEVEAYRQSNVRIEVNLACQLNAQQRHLLFWQKLCENEDFMDRALSVGLKHFRLRQESPHD